MGQITRTTNPTGLKQIDKKLFVVRLDRDVSGNRVFWLDSFDYLAAKLEPYIHLACIAYAGRTEEYFELGPVSDFRKTPTSIRTIATDKPLKFRFIFNKPDESLLVGYAEGVQALDETGYLGSSLVDIEPTDLNGIAWKLMLPEGTGAGDKPNVLVERSLFPTAASAANHPWFSILVMPEVMRQIAMAIAQASSSLDDSETWISSWKDFITALGVSELPYSENDEILAFQNWAEEVVEKFASKSIFKYQKTKVSIDMEGEQP
ncbi:hypothetical protein ABNM12_06635 [Pseudomonas syringae]|uniref:hypothetical protein n=1 Tax=Pseudomonas syringae group TaxID=136849 RepID=UPI0007604B4F|nr:MULTISPECIES: hypothetical protein [Pseudomonas syringae group]KWS18810.1 hypothetical protein AL064_22570 [Pseudomonas syringae pv. syringae]KWS22643.1 hypothetical protein AL061_24665 [Pseudomonas syringae pv. syringae]MCH5511831.1 hypothetical protein [Pseudomonas syringae pv. syringae]MCH5640697.1 hypothetical protein [Pseudomonas syringae pv. syringae]MCH7429754.1 hypothetical protein [Pseudomonas syringae pv. syringae]